MSHQLGEELFLPDLLLLLMCEAGNVECLDRWVLLMLGEKCACCVVAKKIRLTLLVEDELLGFGDGCDKEERNVDLCFQAFDGGVKSGRRKAKDEPIRRD